MLGSSEDAVGGVVRGDGGQVQSFERREGGVEGGGGGAAGAEVGEGGFDGLTGWWGKIYVWIAGG